MKPLLDTLQAFLDEHRDLINEEERALPTDADLREPDKDADGHRELLSAAMTLYSAKLDQKQAEANERHAKAMRGLTPALVVAAVLQICVAVAAVLAATDQVTWARQTSRRLKGVTS